VSDDALALAFRARLPFVGLRDHEHDPELDRNIPPEAARAARVIPLGADGDHLRLAVTDPETDLTVLTPYLAGRDVQIAIAPRDELDAVLGPPRSDPVELKPPATEPEPAAPPPAPAPTADIGGTDSELGAPGPVGPWAAEVAAPEAVAASKAAAGPRPEVVAREVAAPAAEAAAAEPEGAAPATEAAAPEPAPVVAPEPAPVVAPQPAAAAGDELDGETPSWLEPRQTGRRVLVALLTFLLLAVVVAGAVAAYIVASR
jgi:hypothetical protein